MSAPTALLDADVLYDVVLRDLLMQLASSGLFRARWTARINDEWTRNLLPNRSDLPGAQLGFTKALMARAVPNGLVERYEGPIDILQLPDPDDRHVLVGAIPSRFPTGLRQDRIEVDRLASKAAWNPRPHAFFRAPRLGRGTTTVCCAVSAA